MSGARALVLSIAVVLTACAEPESEEHAGADAGAGADEQALTVGADDAEMAPDIGAVVDDPPEAQVACGLRFRVGYLGLGWYWGNCTNRFQYIVWKRIGPDKSFCVKPASYKFITGINIKPNVVVVSNRCP